MKVRFGRDIYCPKCGKDDKLTVVYNFRDSYNYRCARCNCHVPG